MKYAFIILVSMIALCLQAQTSDTSAMSEAMIIQPSIMVIPFTKENQSLRATYEHNEGAPIRATITQLRAAFENKSIKTIDFRTVLKQAESQQLMTGDQQHSIKDRIIQLSAADVYIESETQIVQTPTGNSATVILNAYDAYTGLILASTSGHSPKFYTDNYEKLAEKALETCVGDFVETIQSAFEDMTKNGRSIAIDIGFSDDSSIDMDTPFGENEVLLSDALEDWFETNAHQGAFHVQGITATRMILDEVKILSTDPTTNRNYRPSKFAGKLLSFLKGMGLQVKRDVQGNKIFITIL